MIKDIQKISKTYQQQKEHLERRYNQNLVGAIKDEFDEKYKILSQRKVIPTVSQRELKEAEERYKFLMRIKDEGAYEYFLNESPKEIQELMQILAQNYSEETITSYLAQNQKNSHLLTPLKTQNSGLAKNLEQKINDVLKIGNINTHKKYIFKQTGKQNIAGYTLYHLDIESQHEKFVETLAGKFNHEHIQPKGFKEAELNHKVRIINNEVMDYIRQADSTSTNPIK